MVLISRLANRATGVPEDVYKKLPKLIAAGNISPAVQPSPVVSPANIPQSPIIEPPITPIQPITPAFQTPKPLIPPITAPKPAIVQPMAERMNKLPQRGTLGSTFQGGKIKKRFLADLPANVQLQGINNILSGQNTSSAMVNTFVRTLARQGKTPEQIRQAFIAQQRTSPNPLVIM